MEYMSHRGIVLVPNQGIFFHFNTSAIIEVIILNYKR